MNMLQLGYISLTVTMLAIILLFSWTAIKNSVADPTVRRRKIVYISIGLIAWQVYVYGLASSGLIQNFDFPPRFALLMIIPLFVFSAIFLYRNRNRTWISAVPESWLIYVQSFRIAVESLFVASLAEGILHKNVTIEGYNYDMVIGFAALVVGLLLYGLKLAPPKLALLFNYAGLAILASVIFLFISTIYKPSIYGPETMLMPIEATYYPYVLVAGFLMPLAVFIHLWSILQLRRGSTAKD